MGFHHSLYFLCIVLLLISVFEGFTAPFLPLTLEKKGVNHVWTGVIFAAFPLFQTIASPIIGRWIEFFGHRSLICASTFIMAVSLAALGLIATVAVPSADVGVASTITLFIIARSIGGIASGIAFTTVASFSALVYPDDIEEVISYVEASSGLGVIIGPVLGYFVYDSVGLSIFFVGAVAALPLAPLALVVVPEFSTIARSPNTEPNSTLTPLLPGDNKKPTVGYKMLLLNSRIVFAAICYTAPFFTFGAFQPILSLHFKEAYHFEEKLAGAIFALPALTFVIGTIAAPILIPEGLNRRKALTMVLVLLSFSLLITAPAYYKLSLVASCIGLGLVGFVLGPAAIVPLPEMIQSAKQEFKSYDMEHTTNMLSGMANSVCGIGEILGPLYGGVMYNHFGFQMTVIMMAVLFSSIAAMNIVCTKFVTLKHDSTPEAESITILDNASDEDSGQAASEEVDAERPTLGTIKT